MTSYLQSFFRLFFPNNCSVCNYSMFQHEEFLCSKCNKKLARSYYHLSNDNPVIQSLWGRVPLIKATSFLQYNKNSSTQQLLHNLKYKGMQDVGYYLGKLYSKELSEINFFDEIDLIIPVPLHPKKQQKRGYNQCNSIAKGISEVTALPVDSVSLIKNSDVSTQTRKNRYNRYLSAKDIYSVTYNQRLIGKHILLVDDVLTTGATIEACYSALSEIEGIKLSVLTLAYASR